MGFPLTRLTLIDRLAAGGSEEDWRSFLRDYWGPVCRFALRCGAHDVCEAEEIASQTFLVLLENALLTRWASSHRAKAKAKFHSLLCAVVRKSLASRKRTQTRREQLLGDVVRHVEAVADSSNDDDVFYASWAEALVQGAVDELALEYCRKNQSDRMRVFYGRLCEGLSIAQVAESLGITPASVDFYFREVRDHLSHCLRKIVEPQVRRYCTTDEFDAEFAQEWEQLRRYLAAHGGLEDAVRRAHEALPGAQRRKDVRHVVEQVVARLSTPQSRDHDGSP